MRNWLVILCVFLFAAPAFAEDAAKPDKAAAEIPDPSVFASNHSLKLRGETIKYQAVASETYLRDEKDKPTASVFSVSYVRDGLADPASRPVTFVFNGGPGSASLWLHMGAFGPKQVITPSDATGVGAPPYTIRDNQNSLLDVTDLVFIDPVGTGYSRPLGETEGKEFYGVNEDAESIAEFIRIWLTENGRWNSPKYLAGESYGTTRAAALTEKLQGGWNGIGLNGVILISAILDFQTGRFAPGNDTAHIAFFPSEAAIAWYHGKANAAKWNNDFDAFVADARAFATDTLAPALIRGSTLSAADEARIAQEMSDYLGLSAEWIQQANLRVDASRFRKELLRREGYTVGRFDGRYKGVDSEGTADVPENDPSGYGMDVAYVAAINDYLTRDLDVDFTRPYKVLTGEPGSQWNWSMNERGWPAYVNVTPWLGKGMRENPELRVLLASGWYDLATPFYGAEMALFKNGVVLDRVQFDYYDAGHMMYLAEEDGTKLSDDVRAFIAAGR
ncbi:MAG: peptidase S10 [Hyphomonas sp.]|uniref:S10 family peptidase n=1 Tax=Hyphomonas sp. TaxID=87 RepID=UPI0035270A19